MRCNLHDADIMEEGMLQGITIGKERAKLEAARNLIIKNKLDLEDIAESRACADQLTRSVLAPLHRGTRHKKSQSVNSDRLFAA